jgi:hypothetical protein
MDIPRFPLATVAISRMNGPREHAASVAIVEPEGDDGESGLKHRRWHYA